MESELMVTVKLKLHTRAAWWVRPALSVAFVLASLADRWIDAIVDRGIKVVRDAG